MLEKNKELSVQTEDNKLYKLKEILEKYPMLTTYSVNKAVNEKKMTAIQLGKTRFYKIKDIEDYLNNNKKTAFKNRRN